MRVADYIFKSLKNIGITKVFTLSGGGSMYLNDAAALVEGEIESIFVHHEQSAAMAATAYAKYTGSPSAVCVTTGCGSTNTITGLLEAWQDSIPVIFISGQVNLNQTTHFAHPEIRNLGVQEANIIDIVKPITKYAKMISSVDEVDEVVHEAFHQATSGRKGPVWIDIPMDIQGAQVPDDIHLPLCNNSFPFGLVWSSGLVERFREAKRPVILAGGGVAASGAQTALMKFAARENIPIVTTYMSEDIIKEEFGVHIGTVGIKGNRAANFVMQNSDFLLVLGCRLSVPVTGYNYNTFAREAWVVVVDIDEKEHRKNTVRIDQFIKGDILSFLSGVPNLERSDKRDWLNKCLRLERKWSYLGGTNATNPSDGKIDIYSFLYFLKKYASDNTIFVTDTGSPYYAFGQTMHFRGEQRYITSSAQACMGFALPACVGVAAATNNDIVCVVGEGSLQLNLQEFQTLKTRKANVKIFIINNGVYLSIRSTQLRFFDRIFGTGDGKGLEFPDCKKLADLYGFRYYRIEDQEKLDSNVKNVISCQEPLVCEVIASKDQPIIPMLSGEQKSDGSIVPKPLEDMYPFLDRDEFLLEMDIAPLG